MALDPKFSRNAFDAAPPTDQLRVVLLARLRAAADLPAEILLIVEDLRALGHDLWSWDESIDFAVWSYDYANPRFSNRLYLRFDFDPPDVEIIYGPRPQ